MLLVGLLAGPALAQETRSLHLERVFRIGALDGPPEYALGQVGGVALYPDGRILVLDFADRMLRVYDRTGKFLFDFGGKGEGPGEFHWPLSPMVTTEGVAVYDGELRRLVRFDLDGEHRETAAFATHLGELISLRALRPGRWVIELMPDSWNIVDVAAGKKQPEAANEGRIVLLDHATVDTLARFRIGRALWYGTGLVAFGPVPGASTGPEMLWSVGGDSLLVTVDNLHGRIRWYDARAGAPRLVDERDLSLPLRALHHPSLDSVARALKKKYPGVGQIRFLIPEHEPWFRRAIVDGQGRVWLRQRDRGADKDAPPTYLVVPMHDGEAFRVTLPPHFGPSVIGPDLILGVSVDELGVQYVEGYRYSLAPGGPGS